MTKKARVTYGIYLLFLTVSLLGMIFSVSAEETAATKLSDESDILDSGVLNEDGTDIPSGLNEPTESTEPTRASENLNAAAQTESSATVSEESTKSADEQKNNSPNMVLIIIMVVVFVTIIVVVILVATGMFGQKKKKEEKDVDVEDISYDNSSEEYQTEAEILNERLISFERHIDESVNRLEEKIDKITEILSEQQENKKYNQENEYESEKKSARVNIIPKNKKDLFNEWSKDLHDNDYNLSLPEDFYYVNILESVALSSPLTFEKDDSKKAVYILTEGESKDYWLFPNPINFATYKKKLRDSFIFGSDNPSMPLYINKPAIVLADNKKHFLSDKGNIR